MSNDPNRSAFVQHEYRYETAQDLGIKATYPNARELVHNTNLSDADASRLAGLMLAEGSINAQAFKVTVEGHYGLEDIVGGPMCFVLDAPQYVTDGRVSKSAEFECDPLANRTAIVVRG